VLDGVVSFRVRAFDTNGFRISWPPPPLQVAPPPWFRTNIFAMPSSPAPLPSMEEIDNYTFYSNAVPAAVEIELGILEQRALQIYRTIPVAVEQEKYLRKQAGHVHLFRQRISVRNVDSSAYELK
jgi:hypothetical protein